MCWNRCETRLHPLVLTRWLFTEPAKVNSSSGLYFGLDFSLKTWTTRPFHTANHEMALQDQACKRRKKKAHLMPVTEEGKEGDLWTTRLCTLVAEEKQMKMYFLPLVPAMESMWIWLTPCHEPVNMSWNGNMSNACQKGQKQKGKEKITQSIVKAPWRKEDGRNIRKVNPHPVGLQTLRRRPCDSITRHKTSGVFFWGGMVMSGMEWGGVCVCFEAGSYTPQPSRSLKCCSGLVGETLRSSTSNIHSTETPKP